MHLTDAEIRIMEQLWQHGERTAGQIASALLESVGWNRNTTYTLIKRCVDKGAIERTDPGFRCRAIVAREAVQQTQTETLLSNLFDGSREALFASMLGGKPLTAEEAKRLHEMIDAGTSL